MSAGLGPALLREGLVKDERGRDVPVVPPPGAGTGTAAGPAAAGTGTAPDAGAPGAGAGPGLSMASAGSVDGLSGGAAAGAAAGGVVSEDDDSALVEYEGMLVSGAVAQRRG